MSSASSTFDTPAKYPGGRAARLRLPCVEPLNSRALRPIAFGVVAVGLAYLAGFVMGTLQNPLVLAVVFVLVITGTLLGFRPIRDQVELHARLSVIVLAVAVMVLPLVVLWLVMPTYITAGH
jgi:hypothetical protein